MRIAGAVAAIAAVLTCLVLLFASPSAPAAPAVTSVTLRPAPVRAASCVQRLGHVTSGHLLVVVGASFTAGVGPGNPDRSWAAVLTRTLRWNAVVYGVPGAGYVRSGAGRDGPVAAEIARIDLRALAPSLVIVQAGHDDIGVPPRLEKQRVDRTIELIRAEAPQARIALVTVFPGRASLSAAYRTDRAIVAGATAADPEVIVMDPLAGHWDYQRSADGLHPTVAGSDWLASEVAGVLRGHGMRAARGLRAIPVLCNSGYSATRTGSMRPVPGRKHPPAGAAKEVQHRVTSWRDS
jgi:acyl-CoA thioesterase I